MDLFKRSVHVWGKPGKAILNFVKHYVAWFFFRAYMLGLYMSVENTLYRIIAIILIIITSPYVMLIYKIARYVQEIQKPNNSFLTHRLYFDDEKFDRLYRN